jgi:4-amino-4-deoxy-L-arabinose transferase-like glycosyltransferase
LLQFEARRSLLIISLLAFALRLAYAAASGELRSPQVWEPEQIATNLIEHHELAFQSKPDPLVYRAYIEPLYPFIAAAVYLVTGHSRTALVLLQLAVAAMTVWLIGWVAILATGRSGAGIAAALLMAIHPGLIRYSCILHPLIFDTFFFVAAGGAVIRYRQMPSLRRGALAAFIIGLGVLTRPTILLFLLPLLWIAWRSLQTMPSRFARSAAVVGVTLALIAPWTIRNAIVLHDFVLTRSGTGFVFWLGNNPSASGSAIDAGGRSIRRLASPQLQKRILAAGELARDRIFMQEARDYIRRDPFAAAVRVLKRLGYFWWFSPQWGLLYSPAVRLIYIAWWTILLLLCAIGATVSRRLDVWMLSAMAFLISLGQSLYYVEGRHRLAIEPLILPMAALGVLWLLQVFRRKTPSVSRRTLSPMRETPEFHE